MPRIRRTRRCYSAFGGASTTSFLASPEVSEPRLLTFFPFSPSIQLFRMSITSPDPSLNVALIPAVASTSPSDWGSVATFVFSIRLRTLANRPSMSRVMLEEAGGEIEEDIVLSNLVSQARFYPTSVKTLRPTTPNYAQPRPTMPNCAYHLRSPASWAQPLRGRYC